MLSVTPICQPNGPDEGSTQSSKDLPLTLPAILGRGPQLKCSNVKVSRRHASLDWADDDDDGVAIEALFSQPTFVEIAGVRSKLKSGEKVTLKHGDSFGLLSHTAWYRINIPGARRQEDTTPESVAASNGTPRDSGVEMECRPSCSGADTTDTSIQSKAHSNGEAAAQSSESHTLSTEDRSPTSEAKIACAEAEAARHSPPSAADVDENDSIAAPSSAEKENVATQDSKSTLTTTVNAREKLRGANANTTASEAVVTTTIIPTATSSRARTLPSWMTQEPATTSSPKQQSPASAGRKKNTTRRKPPVKVAPVKRNVHVDQLSASENEDDKALDSPAKDAKVISPSRLKRTENEITSKRALHHLSESDEEDASPARAPEATPTTSRAKFGVANPAGGVSNASSADSDGLSLNASANGAKINVQNNNSSVHSRATKPKQSQHKAINAADEEQATVSDTRPPVRNGTNASNAQSAAASAVKRKSCSYGAGCYRRNPQHKKDEAHPGDPDYASGGDDDNADSDDERPHCEYGVDCYRKNPEHRREYQHTRVPQPQRRVKRKRAAQNYGGQRSDSDTPDEFDMEFLNDASSDDYAPSDSGDSDSERFPSQPLDEQEKKELKRMGKEAKKFIKRGK